MTPLDLSDYASRGPGHWRAPCPECDRGPKDDAADVKVDERGVVAFCHRCGWKATLRREYKPVAPSIPAAHRATPTPPDWRRLWRATQPLSPDCVAGSYLRARGCRFPPAGSHLRWIENARHRSGHAGPALVALVTDATDRQAMTLHRTWITPAGKATVEKPRLLWPGAPAKGGVIRLWPDECVVGGLAIAEGIETALSLAHGFTPVWSCIDAGNLAAFPVLAGVQSLLIGADHDDAGLRAAEACARRWHAAGRPVRIALAPESGADLNDLVSTWAR